MYIKVLFHRHSVKRDNCRATGGIAYHCFTSCYKHAWKLTCLNMAKRMALVPEEVLNRFEGKQRLETSPIISNMMHEDIEMSNILHNPNLPDAEKQKLYNASLERYLQLHQQKDDYIPTVRFSTPAPAAPQPPQVPPQVRPPRVRPPRVRPPRVRPQVLPRAPPPPQAPLPAPAPPQIPPPPPPIGAENIELPPR